ncbi:hypothetical protein ACTFIY_007870 [Dictyostelium cf. discoideum]
MKGNYIFSDMNASQPGTNPVETESEKSPPVSKNEKIRIFISKYGHKYGITSEVVGEGEFGICFKCDPKLYGKRVIAKVTDEENGQNELIVFQKSLGQKIKVTPEFSELHNIEGLTIIIMEDMREAGFITLKELMTMSNSEILNLTSSSSISVVIQSIINAITIALYSLNCKMKMLRMDPHPENIFINLKTILSTYELDKFEFVNDDFIFLGESVFQNPIVLIDFGCSKQINELAPIGFGGTKGEINYVSFQRYFNGPKDSSIKDNEDVFALGVLGLQLLLKLGHPKGEATEFEVLLSDHPLKSIPTVEKLTFESEYKSILRTEKLQPQPQPQPQQPQQPQQKNNNKPTTKNK